MSSSRSKNDNSSKDRVKEVTNQQKIHGKRCAMKIARIWILTLALLPASGCGGEDQFESSWLQGNDRQWVGADYWANRLQDWRLKNGRLECLESRSDKPMRSVHLLTHWLSGRPGRFEMKVTTGLASGSQTLSENAWSGFLFGAGEGALDYRAAALIHHLPGKGGGVIAGVDGTGRLVFRDMAEPGYPQIAASDAELFLAPGMDRKLVLHLNASPTDEGIRLSLSARDPVSGEASKQVLAIELPARRVVGSLALVSHPGDETDKAGFWFENWCVSGDKLNHDPDRSFGPVLGTMYTVSDGVAKMTVQLPPLESDNLPTVRLETWDDEDRAWNVGAESSVVVPGYTAHLRVDNWNDTKDTQYRVLCVDPESDLHMAGKPWLGTIRRNPVDSSVLSVAAFAGNQNIGHPADGDRKRDGWVDSPEVGLEGKDVRWTRENMWFPHEELVANVLRNNVDLLVFTGDQVYEGDSPTKPEKTPEESAYLDYLYKWYLWHWAYRDLTAQYPTICIPDDHDVFQGNLWGWVGRHVSMNNADGGYVMSAEFVKMVERTQTANLPDPYDPTPIERGIGVYYTSLKYGGVDFAILEDRKFKTPSAEPYRSEINDRAAALRRQEGESYAPRKSEVPEGNILGERQLRFLQDWATDWRGVEMKVAVSQTIFACVNTGGSIEPAEPKRDHDSNGWPPAARNQALEELRKAFAFMIGGDQHLGSIVHHGIDEFGDAGFSLCVPSIANYWTRYWSPIEAGENRLPDSPGYTGDFFDGFANRITIHAVANPKGPAELSPIELERGRSELYRKAAGYGIVRFDKSERTITMECWPRWANPTEGEENQFPGWPMTIRQEDNYVRSTELYLSEIRTAGMVDPVIQVVHENTDEILYTLRIKGSTYRPRVFEEGLYAVFVGEPGTEDWEKVTGLTAGRAEEGDELLVDFR